MIPGARSSDGRLTVIQSAPPLGTPCQGGFALSPLGQIYITEVAPAGFDPSQLDLAWWYDPADLTTLFQDTAGTVPVTADGDPVALVVDKGPHGINLIATTGTPGIYRTDGTSHWIETTDGATYSQSVTSSFSSLTLFLGCSIDITDPNGGIWFSNEPAAQYLAAMENGAAAGLTTFYGFPVTAEYLDGVIAPGLTRGGLYDAAVLSTVYSCDISTISPATYLVNGWTAYQIEGRLYSVVAALNMDANERASTNTWVKNQLPPSPAVFTPSLSYSYCNNFLFDPEGRLCCTVADPITHWAGGLPFSDQNELVLTQLDPDANTSYVGGIAVRPEGVCATGATPLSGFSSGFNEGF